MAIKVKFRTIFPALVTAASPLTLVKSGLSYAFGFDIAALRTSLDPIYLVGALTNLILNGSTSGTVTVKAPAVAGTNIITVPAATDTLVGKATTDVLTNKTIDTAGPNSLLVNGVNLATAWTAYTPTITAQTPGGTPPTFTLNSARYKQIGKTILLSVDFTVTNAGTGTGQIFITLPANSAAFSYSGIAFEYASLLLLGGVQVAGATNATRMQVGFNPSGTTFIVTGRALMVSLVYEIP